MPRNIILSDKPHRSSPTSFVVRAGFAVLAIVSDCRDCWAFAVSISFVPAVFNDGAGYIFLLLADSRHV